MKINCKLFCKLCKVSAVFLGILRFIYHSDGPRLTFGTWVFKKACTLMECDVPLLCRSSPSLGRCCTRISPISTLTSNCLAPWISLTCIARKGLFVSTMAPEEWLLWERSTCEHGMCWISECTQNLVYRRETLSITGEHPRLHPPDATFSYGMDYRTRRYRCSDAVLWRKCLTSASRSLANPSVGEGSPSSKNPPFILLYRRNQQVCSHYCARCSIFVVFQNIIIPLTSSDLKTTDIDLSAIRVFLEYANRSCSYCHWQFLFLGRG